MPFRVIVLTVFAVLTLFLYGCNGAVETDQVAWIVGLAIDKSEQPGMLDVSYNVAKPAMAEGGGGAGGRQGNGGGGGGGMAEIITITAPTLDEARNLLGASIGLRPNLSQVKIVFFGEELARQGLGDVIGSIMRSREFRGSMYAAVVRGKAVDYMRGNIPIIGVTHARYYELMMENAAEAGYYLATSLFNFYARMKSGSGGAYAVLLGLNPLSGRGKESGTGVPGEKTVEYLAGDVPRKGTNPAEMAGTALFRGDKMTSMLTDEETRMLAMLLGKSLRGLTVLNDPLFPEQEVCVNVYLGKLPEVKARIADGRAVFTVRVFLEGEIDSIPSGINYERGEYRKLLEEQISRVYQREIAEMIGRTQAAGCDAAGFGYYLRPKFRTRQEFEEFNWPDRYAEADIRVEVITKIRLTGVMVRTTPIQ